MSEIILNSNDVGCFADEKIITNIESWKFGRKSENNILTIRAREADDKVVDKANFTPELANKLIKSLACSMQSVARIMFLDENDKVDRVELLVLKETIRKIKRANIELEIYTENVRLNILPSFLDKKSDNYFIITTIKEKDKQKEIEERAREEQIVMLCSEEQNVSLVTRPITIQSNLKNFDLSVNMLLNDILIPLDEVEQENFLSNLAIYVEHNNGNKEILKPKIVEYKYKTLGLQFVVNEISTFAVLRIEGWKEKLKYHAAYMKVYSLSWFRPEKYITRAEMAVLLANNLYFDSKKEYQSSFVDVNKNYWAHKEIEYVKAAGLMIGDNKNYFYPKSDLTRREMAVIVARHMKLDVPKITTSSFKDVKKYYWGSEDITAVYLAGIMDEYKKGKFNLHGKVTRAETAKIVNRLFNRVPIQSITKKTWNDVPLTHWAFSEIEEATKSHYYINSEDGREYIINGAID